MNRRLIFVTVLSLITSFSIAQSTIANVSGETPDYVDSAIKRVDDSRIATIVFLPVILAGAIMTGLGFGDCHQSDCLHSNRFKGIALTTVIIGTIASAVAGGVWGGTTNSADSIARFRFSSNTQYTPATVYFNGSASTHLGVRNIVKWTWNFGDGQSATSETPFIEHVYNTSGTLTVTLTVKDLKGNTGSSSLPIKLVNGYPQPIFHCDITSPIQFAPVDIACDARDSYARSPNVTLTQFDWDFADGSGFHNNMSKTVNYHLENPGTYGITLRVQDSFDRKSTATNNLVVPDGSPVTDLALAYSNTYHSTPLSVTFDGSHSHVVYPNASMVKYRWSLPSEASFELLPNESQIFTRNYGTPGTYTASLQSFDSTGRKSTKRVDFTLQSPNPIASASATLTNGGYTRSVLTLDASSSRVNYPDTTLASYTVTIPNLLSTRVFYPPTRSISLELTSPGTYNAVLTVADSAGRVSSPANVGFTVKNGKPIASFTTRILSQLVCSKAYFNFDGSSSVSHNGGISQYIWNFNGLGSTTVNSQTSNWFARYSTYRYVNVNLVVKDGLGTLSDSFGRTLLIPAKANDC